MIDARPLLLGALLLGAVCPAAAQQDSRSPWRWGVDGVLVELGRLPDAPEARWVHAARASPFVLWQPARSWEVRAGVVLDAASQSGGPASYREARADIGDTYLRYRSGDTRITAGAQTILWGRVDAMPPGDRVSRVDLTRFMLDDLALRRRAQWAIRWEQGFGEGWKVDAVVLPRFLPARLADERSVWSLVNRQTGRIIGLEPNPALQALVGAATIRDASRRDNGGAALRLTHAGGESLDWGLTLARTRQPLPYYRLDAAATTLSVVHPFNSYAGVDVEWAGESATWRGELGYVGGTLATRPDGQAIDTAAVEAVLGVELTPGGADTRLTLQLAGRALRTSQPTLERKQGVSMTGELESRIAAGRWKAGVQFALGLTHHDVYVSPTLSYLGWEPHELFVTLRHFDGSARSLAGFHRKHHMTALGVRTRF
jgi:hypothetical protein